MAEAGEPADCPECGSTMRRIYEGTTPIIMRPWGYSLKPGDPKYWDGFDNPTPEKQSWQGGRGQKSNTPSPQHVGVGDVYNS